MATMHDLLESAGSLAQLAAKNPQLVAAAISLLSPKDTSVGGGNGLAELVSAFNGQGLGDVMASWIGNGQNQTIGAQQLSSVLGDQTLRQFAAKAGIGADQAAPALAAMLPGLIDSLTPKGQMAEPASLDSALAGLLGGGGGGGFPFSR